MQRLVISLSSSAYERLQKRAARFGKRPETLSREILEEALRSEGFSRKTTWEVLEAAGRLGSLGDDLRRTVVRDVPLEEVRAALTLIGGPSLSEILLEQRGPKD